MDTLAGLLSSRVAVAPAVLFGDDVLTYGDLDARSTQVAHALIAAGVRAGDVVCQILGSRPQLIVNLFGILKSGATYAPLNPALTRPEMRGQLEDCRPSLVIVERDVADQSRDLVPEGSRVLPTEDLSSTSVEMPLSAPGLPIDPDGPAFLFYTSGTTGRAKGVQLSHRNVLTNARQVLERTGVGPQDRLLVVMPIFHVNGLCNQVVLPFLASASIALRPRFVLEEFWPDVVRYRPTYFTAVPTILSRLLDGPDPPPDVDFSALRFARTGAAPLSIELQRRFEERFGLPVIAGYGLSEATCTVTMNPPTVERRRLGSVGRPLQGLEVRILGRMEKTNRSAPWAKF